MYQQYRNQGFQVLSIGYDEEVAHVNSWISMFSLTYPVLRDPGGSVSTLFIPVVGGYLYFPHNTLIDTWQVVHHTATGFSQGTIQSLVLSLMDPAIFTNLNELDFGEVVVGESAERTFTIDNAGTGILNVTNIVSSCPRFSPNPTSGEVYAVDDSMAVTVTYSPTEVGECNETLTVQNNDQDVIINVHGEAVATSVPLSNASGIPNTFGLDACYPNPFNAQTIIPYRVPSESAVSIVIYSVDGRLMAILNQGRVLPGNHRVSWSPDEATTGVYFVELRADGRPIDVQKILYLK
jgi:hypothetical protein